MKTTILTKAILVAVLTFASIALPAYAQTMCTMDAMQCPDGSWVGRSGPNCEFVCSGESGGGSPGYDGGTGGKPTYPTTPASTGIAPDPAINDRDFTSATSSGYGESGYVDIMKSDIESGQLEPIDLPSDIEQAGRVEQEDVATKEEQSSETGYFKNLLNSIVSFIGGLFNWNQ